MKKKLYTGLNVQYPISRKILSGQKTIETRTYPLPEKYIGTEMLLIETPGAKGKFKSRIVAVIKFTESFKYNSKSEFYNDFEFHKVDKTSPWAWDPKKGKWGWRVKLIKQLKTPIPLNKRGGIKFTTDLSLVI